MSESCSIWFLANVTSPYFPSPPYHSIICRIFSSPSPITHHPPFRSHLQHPTPPLQPNASPLLHSYPAHRSEADFILETLLKSVNRSRQSLVKSEAASSENSVNADDAKYEAKTDANSDDVIMDEDETDKINVNETTFKNSSKPANKISKQTFKCDECYFKAKNKVT